MISWESPDKRPELKWAFDDETFWEYEEKAYRWAERHDGDGDTTQERYMEALGLEILRHLGEIERHLQSLS